MEQSQTQPRTTSTRVKRLAPLAVLLGGLAVLASIPVAYKKLKGRTTSA